MHIKFVEMGNFRRLNSVRIDLSPQKSIFVGANNSGKTSAMVALRYFLMRQDLFSINDFTISLWSRIDEMGINWEAARNSEDAMPDPAWDGLVPFLDVWLEATDREIHHVQKILPTLDWEGGLLGVRIRYEPKDPQKLQDEFLSARADAQSAFLEGSSSQPSEGNRNQGAARRPPTIWPESLTDFLKRKLRDKFTYNSYILDSDALVDPVNGRAQPQLLPALSGALEVDPFKGLIQINEIPAQRGFGQEGGEGSAGDMSKSRRLSAQLQNYYNNHLDPYVRPDSNDIELLTMLEQMRETFDGRLQHGFDDALRELAGVGYPGGTNPDISIASEIKPMELLRHDSAVRYGIPTTDGSSGDLYLPEGSNGLGYQNLISMIFQLMSFRDRWMRVGKFGRDNPQADTIPRLHIVLVEEPEAHLHAQVQQVFINKAYGVLRRHTNLQSGTTFETQLIVSTHSSHIAHECSFSDLRYFRRYPARNSGEIPTTDVVNLTNVFGEESETTRFVTRYLKINHSDLFFADGAILVEGPAERILLPFFVRKKEEYRLLNERYITWLEIGGSHAHRLKQLIEKLGLTTLIITDIDSKDQNESSAPRRGNNQTTRNATLKGWIPGIEEVDRLLDLPEDNKVLSPNLTSSCLVRAAYQTPVMVSFPIDGDAEVEALPYTFEDAVIYHNLGFFSDLDRTGELGKVERQINDAQNISDLRDSLFTWLKSAQKAEFAMDILELENAGEIQVPLYIDEGLHWFSNEISRRQRDVEMTAQAVEESDA